jgi:L-ascorbate metabolism protein UlaG (beta-lactamase superfamily)
MQLTYIFHSGFALETDEAVLVFDCWMDPAQVIPPLLAQSKPLYVFVSHFHEDHFNPDILTWRTAKSDITYIFSKDILRRRRCRKEDAQVWLAKGGTWHDACLRVWAMGSNDSGVSWIVETAGRRIFHAGDLNNWYARFLQINVPGQPVQNLETLEDVDPVAEEKRFLGELKDIRKVADSFDLVMFPVDGRIGNGYTLGGRQFIDRFRVGLFVPMHFVASGFESAWRFKEFADAKGVGFWCIGREGEGLILKD